VVEAGGIAVTIEKAPCFSGRRWHEAYEACDGKGLAAALTSATGRQYRFLGESPADLMFDMPGEPLSILHLPIRADVTKLLFELAAKVVERDERSSSSDKAKVSPPRRAVVGEWLPHGAVIDYGADGRLISWNGKSLYVGCAGEDLSEGDVVELRGMLWYRVKPEAENPIER
jgi:hypothetical protein